MNGSATQTSEYLIENEDIHRYSHGGNFRLKQTTKFRCGDSSLRAFDFKMIFKVEFDSELDIGDPISHSMSNVSEWLMRIFQKNGHGNNTIQKKIDSDFRLAGRCGNFFWVFVINSLILTDKSYQITLTGYACTEKSKWDLMLLFWNLKEANVKPVSSSMVTCDHNMGWVCLNCNKFIQ